MLLVLTRNREDFLARGKGLRVVWVGREARRSKTPSRELLGRLNVWMIWSHDFRVQGERRFVSFELSIILWVGRICQRRHLLWLLNLFWGFSERFSFWFEHNKYSSRLEVTLLLPPFLGVSLQTSSNLFSFRLSELLIISPLSFP